jgi:hypothetical protein
VTESNLKKGANMPGVDGNAVLYHYLQKSLPVEDIWFSRMVVGRLVDGLAV